MERSVFKTQPESFVHGELTRKAARRRAVKRMWRERRLCSTNYPAGARAAGEWGGSLHLVIGNTSS